MVKAKKLKIIIKTPKYSLPIPTLHFRTIRWISKFILKCSPTRIRIQLLQELNNELTQEILKNLTSKDIDEILNELENLEPFELITVEDYNENGEIYVKISTLN